MKMDESKTTPPPSMEKLGKQPSASQLLEQFTLQRGSSEFDITNGGLTGRSRTSHSLNYKPQSAAQLRMLADRLDATCLIRDRQSQDVLGSGVLIDGLYVLTSASVIPNRGVAEKSEAVFFCDGESSNEGVTVERDEVSVDFAPSQLLFHSAGEMSIEAASTSDEYTIVSINKNACSNLEEVEDIRKIQFLRSEQIVEPIQQGDSVLLMSHPYNARKSTTSMQIAACYGNSLVGLLPIVDDVNCGGRLLSRSPTMPLTSNRPLSALSTQSQTRGGISRMKRGSMERQASSPEEEQMSVAGSPLFNTSGQLCGIAMNDSQALTSFAVFQTIKEFVQTSERVTASSACVGEYEKAVASFEPLTHLHPKTSTPYIAKGLASLVKGNISDAVSCFSQGVAEAPKDIDVLVLRAHAYQCSERYDEAVEDLTKIIEARPDAFDGYYLRGVVNHARYKKEETAAARDIARENGIHTGTSIGYKQREVFRKQARAHLKSATHSLEKAVADFSTAIGIDSTISRAYFARGLVYMDLGKLTMAESDFRATVHLDVDCVDAYFYSASIFSEQGKLALAIQNCNEVINRNPNHASAYALRSDLYERRSKEDALKAKELEEQGY